MTCFRIVNKSQSFIVNFPIRVKLCLELGSYQDILCRIQINLTFIKKTRGRRVVTVSEGLKILLSKNPDFRAFSSFSHANLTTLEWVLKVK